MRIRQPVEQSLHRLVVLRMDPVRIEFGHRHQDEPPLMKTGMRNGELRGVDDPLSIEQHVQINGAGSVSQPGVTTQAPFRFPANGQQVFRLELRLETNDPRYRTTCRRVREPRRWVRSRNTTRRRSTWTVATAPSRPRPGHKSPAGLPGSIRRR